MAKQIIWTPEAFEDLIEILDYWDNRIGNNYYSDKLEQTIYSFIDNLVIFPNMGKRYKDSDIRCFVKENYEIYYSYTSDELEILQIWDTRRNPETLII